MIRVSSTGEITNVRFGVPYLDMSKPAMLGSTSSRNMGAVVGCGDLVASPFIHKVGDERQVSDQSGRLAQRTLSGGFRHAQTLNRQIRTAAASLKETVTALL